MPEATAVICVVDDDAMVRKAIARLLRSAGFATETFESAEAFLRSPHRDACTCLLLDIDLPGQSGQELAHSFTAAKSHVPIVFLTAREPSAADACPSRAVAWLTKSFEADDLFAAIREALTRAGKESA
jgi:FixJ family two-component response regulator